MRSQKDFLSDSVFRRRCLILSDLAQHINLYKLEALHKIEALFSDFHETGTKLKEKGRKSVEKKLAITQKLQLLVNKIKENWDEIDDVENLPEKKEIRPDEHDPYVMEEVDGFNQALDEIHKRLGI